MPTERRTGWVAPALLFTALAFFGAGCCTVARIANAYCTGDHLIVVFQNGEVSLGKVKISKTAHHQIIWKAAYDVPLETIVITLKAGQKPPFKKCATAPSVCTIECEPDGYCFSGPIDDNANDEENNYYEYNPALRGGPGPDPGFIIKK